METQIDKIVNILYLARSDSREKMLTNLIINILYQWNEGLCQKDIIQLIREEFHLEPIIYEIEQCLSTLIVSNTLNIKSTIYTLTKDEFQRVHGITLINKEKEEKRYLSFKMIINECCGSEIPKEDLDSIWYVFNNYIYESFLEYGREAIDIFLPYNKNDYSNLNVAQNALRKIDPKYHDVFKKLVFLYPNKLNSEEIKFLYSLAEKAELFYSLGMEKKDYEKVQSLKFENQIILVDTNFLYSALKLRFHPENSAVSQIIDIAKNKTIDLRIVYLAPTFSELKTSQEELEELIPRMNFTQSHILSLLGSKQLDSFSKTYYEQKLKDSETPHPSDKIQHARDILNYLTITVYNHRFPTLENDDKYLNSKIKEYYEFQRIINEVREEKGFDLKTKTDKKIEHDVFLRECILELKKRYTSGDDLKFVCLTLDNQLIKFDLYTQRKQSGQKDKIVNPSFILPSIFLKRIRPFLPLKTDDYEKAFVSSITASTFDSDNIQRSKSIQKSMSTFKKLGIDDENAIMSIIKREMFLQEFEKNLKNEKEDEFIQSELDIYLKKIEADRISLQQKIEEEQKHRLEMASKSEKALTSQKVDFESQIADLGKVVEDKNGIIQTLVDRMTALEGQSKKDKEDRDKLLKETKYKDELPKYINAKIKENNKNLRSGLYSSLLSIFLISLPTFLGIIFSVNGKEWIKTIMPLWLFILIFVLITAGVVYYRTVLISREKQKDSISYYYIKIFNRHRYAILKEQLINRFTDEFNIIFNSVEDNTSK